LCRPIVAVIGLANFERFGNGSDIITSFEEKDPIGTLVVIVDLAPPIGEPEVISGSGLVVTPSIAANIEPVSGIVPILVSLVLSYFVGPFFAVFLVQTNPVSSAFSPAFSGLEIDIVVVVPIYATIVDTNIIVAVLLGSGSTLRLDDI